MYCNVYNVDGSSRIPSEIWPAHCVHITPPLLILNTFPLLIPAHDTFHHLRTFPVHGNGLQFVNAPYQFIRDMYVRQCPERLIQKLQHLGLIVRFSCIIPGQIHKIESVIGTFYIRTQFLEIIGNRGRHQRIRCPPSYTVNSPNEKGSSLPSVHCSVFLHHVRMPRFSLFLWSVLPLVCHIHLSVLLSVSCQSV